MLGAVRPVLSQARAVRHRRSGKPEVGDTRDLSPGVGLAVSRALRSWFATTRLLRDWLASATPIELEHLSAPAFSIPHQFPIIAVVGTIRPRLFIAERVLQSLTGEELMASIAHESGHLNARDNLKRSLLRACRDLLMLIPSGRSLDRAWAEAAECCDYAANEGEDCLDGAALVKIARMIPSAARPHSPFSSSVLKCGVKAPVRRPLDLAQRRHHTAR